MHWSDQLDVDHQETLSHIYLGDGLSAEIEKIGEGDAAGYRLTIGSLFASESVRYPATKEGLEDLLRTLHKARNEDSPVEPIGGTLEERDRG